MKIKVDKDGFVQGDPKIKTPEEVEGAKIEEVRKLMQGSLDSALTADQRLDFYIKVLGHEGFQLLPKIEYDSYNKKKHKELGPLDVDDAKS